MTKEADDLKAQDEGGQGDNPLESVVTPPRTEGEEEITPENAVQQAKTFRGMLQKAQGELATLTQERADYQGLVVKIDNLGTLGEQHGQTLDLVTEILSTSAEANEELQEKVKKAQEERERRTKTFAESQEALVNIKGVYEAAGMKAEDEALKPSRDAYEKGNYQEALRLTVVAVKGKISAPPTGDISAGDGEGSKVPAKNLKVITKPSAPGKSTEDMTPREKVLAGLQEARDKQGS